MLVLHRQLQHQIPYHIPEDHLVIRILTIFQDHIWQIALFLFRDCFPYF